MFANFLKRLTSADTAQLPADEAHLALGALLVRLARTDGEYSPAEAEHIATVLARRYELSEAEAHDLLGRAETLESEAPDTVRFTKAIKNHVTHEDRAEVIEDLWEVALTDGARDHEEDSLMRLVASMLGINDRDSALARQRVSERLAG